MAGPKPARSLDEAGARLHDRHDKAGPSLHGLASGHTEIQPPGVALMQERTASARHALFALVSIVTVLISTAIHAGSPPTLWTSRFEGGEAYAEPLGVGSPQLLSTPTGELFAWNAIEPLLSGSALVRIDPASMLPMWSAIAPIGYQERGVKELIALDDGSTLLFGDHLSLFSSTGNFVWVADGAEFLDVAGLPGGDVAVVAEGRSSPVIRRLSGDNGAVRESLTLPVTCDRTDLVAAAHGGLWLACGDRITQVLDAPLRLGWSVSGRLGGLAVAPDGSALYEWSVDRVIKRSPASGEILWSSQAPAPAITRLHITAEGDVFSSGAAIDRWDAVTGTVLWHADESGVAAVDDADEGIFFARTRPADSPGGTLSGVVGRLDGATGTATWRNETLPAAHAVYTSIAAGSSAVHVSGIVCTPIAYYPCRAMLWSFAPESGALSGQQGLLLQSATEGAAAEREDSGHLFVAAREWGTGGPRAHVHVIDEDTGVLASEARIEIPGDGASAQTQHRLSVARVPADRAAITLSTESIDVDNERFDASITLASTLDGTVHWHHALSDAGARGAISAPIVDAAGNITVGTAEQDVLGVPSPTRRWIRQYSAGSGEVLWSREVESPAYFPPFVTNYAPASVYALGDCIATAETLIDDTRTGTKCLSSQDGSVRWVSTLLGGLGTRTDATSVVTAASGPSSSITWRKFDLATGSVVWETTYADPSVNSFSIHGTIADGSGNLYSGVSARLGPPPSLDMHATLFRLDAATGSIVWEKRLDTNPVGPRSRVNPRFVKDGKVYATQQIREANTFGYALTAFSPTDGTPLGSGFLYASFGGEPHRPQLAEQSVFALSDGGGMLIGGQQSIPGRPGEFVMANWGAPMPGIPGELSVELSIHSTSTDGAIDHEFTFETGNAGTVDASRVQADLRLPDSAIVRNLSCTLGSEPCQPNRVAATLFGEFPIAAGQTLRIAGIARVPTGARTPEFHAHAFALHPFFELDLVDNVASVEVDLLFRNGFESIAEP